MLFKTITIDVEAKVDLDEILQQITTDDLIKELDARGEEFDNTDNEDEYHILDKLYHTKDNLYRHLCDICDCGYYEPKDSLLNKLSYLHINKGKNLIEEMLLPIIHLSLKVKVTIWIIVVDL